MAAIRSAAVAGMFYPGEARALAAELDELLGGVEQSEPRLGFPKALIVPHAGYIYSGPIAARAYEELGNARGIVRRVVMLGPVPRVPVRGLAIPPDDAFATPLGSVPIDRQALDSVRDLPQIVASDLAHLQEHALEVQLPFLQRQLGEFSLAPFAVGSASVPEVAAVIERLWGGPETLIVISTDLSHYHAYADAREIDRSTVTRIAAFAADLDHAEAGWRTAGVPRQPAGRTPLGWRCRGERDRRGFPRSTLPARDGCGVAGPARGSVAAFRAEAAALRRRGRSFLAAARRRGRRHPRSRWTARHLPAAGLGKHSGQAPVHARARAQGRPHR